MVTNHPIPNPHPDRAKLAALSASLVPVIEEAGRAILSLYGTALAIEEKGDNSPVTVADRVAEGIILRHLEELTPDLPVVAEEAASSGQLPSPGPLFWLVDPLDGTKEFIRRNGEFTVNVALVADGVPVLGLVLAPAISRLYTGIVGLGAFRIDENGRRQIRCRVPPDEGLTVVASRSHGDPAELERFLAGRKVAALRNAGSSLKICLVAEGEADLYPRLGRTMEWDIAAGHAVLAAAGGTLRTIHGEPMRYGKPEFENPHFVASGAC